MILIVEIKKTGKTTKTIPKKQIIKQSKVSTKQMKVSPSKLASVQISISTIPSTFQQLQVPQVKQSEIELSPVSQQKMTGKEGSNEVDKVNWLINY